MWVMGIADIDGHKGSDWGKEGKAMKHNGEINCFHSKYYHYTQNGNKRWYDFHDSLMYYDTSWCSGRIT